MAKEIDAPPVGGVKLRNLWRFNSSHEVRTWGYLACGFESHWEYLLISLVKAQTWARLYGEVRYTCDKGHEHPDDAAPIRTGERPGFNSHMSQRNFKRRLVQPGRTPALGAECRRFKSVISDQFISWCSPIWQQATVSNSVQCGFESLHQDQFV